MIPISIRIGFAGINPLDTHGTVIIFFTTNIDEPLLLANSFSFHQCHADGCEAGS